MKNLQEKKPKSLIKYGDCFRLGSHILCCGDARDKDIVEKVLNGQKIRCIISDVPYGVAVVENKAGFKQKLSCEKEILNDHEQSEEEYKEFTKKWLKLAVSFLEKKNSIYIFNSDRMIFALRSGMIDAGCKFSQLLVWIKNQPVIGRLDYLPQHELIAYGWYGTHLFRKSKDKSLLFAPKPSKSKFHPTMKPMSLLRQIILNATEIDDVVYDCFGGSGTALLAAEQTKRKCCMIELDSEYCQIIIDRYESLTGDKAIKI